MLQYYSFPQNSIPAKVQGLFISLVFFQAFNSASLLREIVVAPLRVLMITAIKYRDMIGSERSL